MSYILVYNHMTTTTTIVTGPFRFLLYSVHNGPRFHPLGGTAFSSPKANALPKPAIPPYAMRTLHIRGIPPTVYNCLCNKLYTIHTLRC